MGMYAQTQCIRAAARGARWSRRTQAHARFLSLLSRHSAAHIVSSYYTDIFGQTAAALRALCAQRRRLRHAGRRNGAGGAAAHSSQAAYQRCCCLPPSAFPCRLSPACTPHPHINTLLQHPITLPAAGNHPLPTAMRSGQQTFAFQAPAMEGRRKGRLGRPRHRAPHGARGWPWPGMPRYPGQPSHLSRHHGRVRRITFSCYDSACLLPALRFLRRLFAGFSCRHLRFSHLSPPHLPPFPTFLRHLPARMAPHRLQRAAHLQTSRVRRCHAAPPTPACCRTPSLYLPRYLNRGRAAKTARKNAARGATRGGQAWRKRRTPFERRRDDRRG